MGFMIAITGKGGVGKTTVSSLIISRLIANGKEPVLAIDADPNSCLDAALGVKVTKSVGAAREEVRKEANSNAMTGISKTEMLQVKISESLVEAKGFDLISMGRPEGAGCYCFANSVLKSVINEISDQYPYVVLDNEAGLENLSRRIVQNVDVLILISDASNSGLQTLARLHAMTSEMNIEYKKLFVIVNRLRSDALPQKAEEIRAITNADKVIGLPDDPVVADFAERNQCFLELPEDNPVLLKINELVNNF